MAAVFSSRHSEFSAITEPEESECVHGLRGPYATQLTAVRQIFSIPLWYSIDTDEFQVYKDLVHEAGTAGARLARVLQCSTVDNCQCYFCVHVDGRSRSPSSSLSRSAWSPVRGQVADHNGSPIFPKFNINEDGYHVEISPEWPFSGHVESNRGRNRPNQDQQTSTESDHWPFSGQYDFDLSLIHRKYSNQPVDTPRRQSRSLRPRRLFSPAPTRTLIQVPTTILRRLSETWKDLVTP